MCQRSSFICGCDTVLSNNKRYLTIAFTVLEEIYFSLPAQKKSTLPSGGNHRDTNKGNNIQVGITCKQARQLPKHQVLRLSAELNIHYTFLFVRIVPVLRVKTGMSAMITGINKDPSAKTMCINV